MKKVWKKALKIFLWIAGILLGLILLVTVALRIPAVQDYVADKAVSVASDKLETKITIGSIFVLPPNSVSLKELYVEGNKNDTLAYIGELKLNIGLFQLLDNKIEINKLKLEKLTARIKRYGPDSTFNFEFPGLQSDKAPAEAEKDTSGSSWTFDIDKIYLDDIDLSFDDQTTGNEYATRLGKLRLKIDHLDPEKSDFGVKSLLLADTYIDVSMRSASGDTTNEQPEMPDITIEKFIRLDNVNVNYENEVDGQALLIENAHLNIEPSEIDLANNLVVLDVIDIHDTHIGFVTSNDTVTASDSAEQKDTATMDWRIAVHEFNMENNSLQFSNRDEPEKPGGLDPAHIAVNDLAAVIRDIRFTADTVKAAIGNFEFTEGGEFALREFAADIGMVKDRIFLENGILRTDHTSMDMDMVAENVDFNALEQNMGDILLDINISNGAFHRQDLLYFYPGFSSENPYNMQRFLLAADIDGRVDDLNINNMRAAVDRDVIVRMHGSISGLPDVKQSYADITIDSLFARGNKLQRNLPDTMIPENINIPARMLLHGFVQGDMEELKSRLDMESTAGNFKTKLDARGDTAGSYNFDFSFNTDGIDAGEIVDMGDTLGRMVLDLNAKGTVKDFEIFNADIDFNADTLTLIGYPYNHLSVEGEIANNYFRGDAEMEDSNIVFTFNGMIDNRDSVPVADFLFNLKGADLKKLHLSEEELRLALDVEANIKGSDPDDLNGELSVNDIIVVDADSTYRVDSINVLARNKQDRIKLQLNSDFIHGEYSGSVKFQDISGTVMAHINSFLEISKDQLKETEVPQQFRFDLEVEDHPLISSFLLDGLTQFNGLKVKARYNQDEKLFTVESTVMPLQYNDLEVDSLQLMVNSEDSALSFNMNSSGIYQDPLHISGMKAGITLADQRAEWSFKVHDEEGDDEYNLKGDLRRSDNAIIANISNNNLILDKKNWDIDLDNAVLFYDDSTSIKHFTLSRNKQVLNISQVAGEKGGDKTKVKFENFHLSTLTNIATNNFADAVINGVFTVEEGDVEGISADLDMKDVILDNNQMFTHGSIDASFTDGDKIEFKADFAQEKGRMDITGSMTTGDKPDISAGIMIDKINLHSFQPLLEESVDSISGLVKADIKISGSPSSPDIAGDLQLIQSYVFPSILGTGFKTKHNVMRIENDALVLEDFTIYDETGRKAYFNGKVENLTQGTMRLNMRADADAFTWVNSNRGNYELFYGKLSNDLDASITGPVNALSVELTTTIRDNTDFNFIIPQNQTATIEREGLVRFLDKEKQQRGATNRILYPSGSREEQQEESDEVENESNVEITARININPEARLAVVMNPATNEKLEVQGEGSINYNLTSTGQQTITGKYDIVEGFYYLILYDVIRREFSIREGSSLTFNGDLMDARADITAVHEVRTSPEALVANEISGAEGADNTRFQSSLPFNVVLNIDGEIMKPDLDFDIELPPDNQVTEVQNKLNQINENESQVNKQAFALLVFGSFLETSMSSGHPLSYQLSSTARSSVSNIISAQLNQLAEKYIQGIEINVDVKSYTDYVDEQSKGTTNVEFDVKKQFLNERLTVQVGGKVNVEGRQQRANEDVSTLSGDVRVFYDLTEDGRWVLKGFNVNEYGNLLEGEIRKTGVGIIYNRDMYKLSDLWSGENQKPTEKQQKEDRE